MSVASTLRALLIFAVPGMAANLSAGQALLREAAETNVNQRYTIESISVGGVQVRDAKLPGRLRQRLNSLVGQHCDMAMLEDLAVELRRELHLREVNHHLLRGSQPDRIRVNYEIVKRPVNFDVSVPRFLYHSQQGFTAELNASARTGANSFALAMLSNGDELTERFTGLSARFENSRVGTDKVRFAVGVEDYHDQWSGATRTAVADAPALDLYRTRRNIAPEITVAMNRNLTVSGGMSFERMQSENPAVGSRAANAWTAEVHYGRRFEGDTLQEKLDGKYTLRGGTRALGSDYSYSRHLVTLRYEVKAGRQTASDEIGAGAMSGNGPLFERFVLGNSSTLRGWDRYAMDPLGSSRMVRNSLTYGYQFGEGTAEVFYDSGAVWGSLTPRTGTVRHSLGMGYRQGVFVLTMAFPLIDGRIAPVFMAGMNY